MSYRLNLLKVIIIIILNGLVTFMKLIQGSFNRKKRKFMFNNNKFFILLWILGLFSQKNNKYRNKKKHVKMFVFNWSIVVFVTIPTHGSIFIITFINSRIHNFSHLCIKQLDTPMLCSFNMSYINDIEK